MRLKIHPPHQFLLRAAAVPALAFALIGGAPDAAPAQVGPQSDALTLLFTSDVQGELKSCGCPKVDLGGITHRAAFLDTLRGAGWEFLTFDAGGLVPPGPMNEQKRLKTEYLVKAMATMRLDAVGLNDWDLAQGPDEVTRLVDWLGQPVVATNYDLPPSVPSVRAREFTMRGRSVAIVSFLDPRLVTPAHDWIAVRAWEEERPFVQDLAARMDVLVAMAAVPDSAGLVAFAEAFPEFRLVVGTHRGELPSTLTMVGEAGVIGGGSQGRNLGRAEIDFDAEGRPSDVRGTFLQVLDRWGRRPWTDAIVTEYNRRLRSLLLEGASSGGD